MTSWKEVLTGLVTDADDYFDKLKFQFKKKLNLFDPVQICAYRSYGSHKEIHVRGRVMEDKGITKSADNDTIWDNILNMYKRFESDEVPGARLSIQFDGKKYETISDDEGYFYFDIIPDSPFPEDQHWFEAEIELLESPIPFTGKVSTVALIYIPPRNAEFGIISDIDDTVIESFATNRLKMAQTIFLKNSRSRSPFEGVSAFYKALQLGSDGHGMNPIFYVSSSPWNLYDFLIDFLGVHDIPHGPLLLRDTGTTKENIFAKNHKAHKYHEIERILNTYPHLNFILIGDSGQQDPVIYHEVIENFPDRILAAYIRDVKLPDRAKVVVEIAEKLQHGEIPMVLIENTVKAAEHAIQNGYISPEQMPEIEIAKMVDNSLEVDKMEKETPQQVAEEVTKEIKDAEADPLEEEKK
ncbi:MAG: App1 family protein [Bacteroidia bacterium]